MVKTMNNLSANSGESWSYIVCGLTKMLDD